MKDVAKVVEELVNAIDCTIEAKYDALTSAYKSCHTKWMRVGKSVWNVDGYEYKVTGLDRDVQFFAQPVLGSATPLDKGAITLQNPFWITGTHIATNNEWTKAGSNLLSKTPLAWLLEALRMQKHGLGSTIDFDSDIRIFFLDETDVVNYYTADHREQVVEPMEELAKGFIDAMASNRKFKTVEDYEMLTFSRFGVERSDGMFQNILDANLSGVELRVTLTKFKENCKC
jgi:hypothetical protein